MSVLNRLFWILIICGFINAIPSAWGGDESVLVRYKNGTIKSLTNGPHADFVRIETDNADELARKLNHQVEVDYAEPDYDLELASLPNDPLFDEFDFENLFSIGMETVWDFVNDCQSVLVGIPDTGIDLDHPDLQANIWSNPTEISDNEIDDDENGYVDDVNGYDFSGQTADVNDEHGHGTMVAGVIGAVGDNGMGLTGVCWKANLVPLKIKGDDGKLKTSAAIEAIDYAIGEGIRIVNLSWVLPRGVKSLFLEEAMMRGAEAGILFVTAAGNDKMNLDETPIYPASSDLSTNIVVAATNEGGGLASFSSYGNQTVDLAAPGDRIVTTGREGKYVIFSGTSAAVAHVSGSAALLLTLDPSLTAEEVRQMIIENVLPDEALQESTSTGGILDLSKALTTTGTNETGDTEISTQAEGSDEVEDKLSEQDSTSSPSYSSGATSGCELNREKLAALPATIFHFTGITLIIPFIFWMMRGTHRRKYS